MPNLLMSTGAARACHAPRRAGAGTERWLAWDDYIHVLDFYEESGIRQLSMVEADLAPHPDLPDMLNYALWRDFDARITTSGVLGAEARARLARVLDRHAAQRVRFVVHAPHPKHVSAERWNDLSSFLALAGRRATLSVRLEGPELDLDFAFELVARHGLDDRLRLVLSVPAASNGSSASPIVPYRAVAGALHSLVPRFEASGLTPTFGCGFPACMFTDAQLGALTKLGAVLNPTCDPLVDIGPDLGLWPGLPVSGLRDLSLYDFQSMGQVVDRYRETLARHRVRAGMLPECEPCGIRARGLCGGGCFVHQLSEEPVEQVHAAPSRRHLPVA